MTKHLMSVVLLSAALATGCGGSSNETPQNPETPAAAPAPAAEPAPPAEAPPAVAPAAPPPAAPAPRPSVPRQSAAPSRSVEQPPAPSNVAPPPPRPAEPPKPVYRDVSAPVGTGAVGVAHHAALERDREGRDAGDGPPASADCGRWLHRRARRRDAARRRDRSRACRPRERPLASGDSLHRGAGQRSARSVPHQRPDLRG